MGRWRPRVHGCDSGFLLRSRLLRMLIEDFEERGFFGAIEAQANRWLKTPFAAMFAKVLGSPKIAGGWFLDLRVDGHGRIWNLLVPLIRQMTKLCETALGCSYSITCFQVLYRSWPSKTHSTTTTRLSFPLKVGGCWLLMSIKAGPGRRKEMNWHRDGATGLLHLGILGVCFCQKFLGRFFLFSVRWVTILYTPFSNKLKIYLHSLCVTSTTFTGRMWWGSPWVGSDAYSFGLGQKRSGHKSSPWRQVPWDLKIWLKK